MATNTIVEHSSNIWVINCFCVLPITLRIPISFNRLLDRATVVLEKLRHVHSSISTPVIKAPYAAASDGR